MWEIYLGKFWHNKSEPEPKFQKIKLRYPGPHTKQTHCQMCREYSIIEVTTLVFSVDLQIPVSQETINDIKELIESFIVKTVWEYFRYITPINCLPPNGFKCQKCKYV